MEFAVTSDEMRKCDTAASRELNLPAQLLMEHAGHAVVSAMERRCGGLSGKRAIIVCGKGNNGGDGLVAARLLIGKGMEVTVVLCAKLSDLTNASRLQAERFVLLLKAVGASERSRLLQAPTSRQLGMLPDADFILDAVFGTGFSGRARGVPARAIEWMNRAKGLKIALDLPSGVDADTGRAEGPSTRADWTVTFQSKKVGVMLCEGRDLAGQVEVVDIGIPQAILARFSRHAGIVTPADVASGLPVRRFDAHKHTVGKVLVIAGSVGLAGAAAMTAYSALRSGAGAVVLCAPKSLTAVLSRKLTEVMVVPMNETALGTLAESSLEALKDHLEWADVVAMGPGLSRNEETVRLIRSIVALSPQRLVLDADGINAFAGAPGPLRRTSKKASIVLTPHTGEFSRLTGIPAPAIEADRLGAARSFARRISATIVLKGSPTVTAFASGQVALNATGNPGMATAGSGDVLTGLIAGLWAQGTAVEKAAFGGVFLHGLAGDLARDRLGERSLLALDILEELPRAFAGVEKARVGRAA